MSLIQTLLSFTGALLILLTGVLIVCLSIYFVRKNPKRGFTIQGTFLLLFMFFQYCDEVDKVFLPTQSISSFSDLSEEVDWPLELYKVESGKEEFIEAVVAPGKLPTLIRLTSFRSGMPAYIFDIKGKLVDSTDDNLDDPRYQDKWYKPSYSPRQQITDNPFSPKSKK
ncbi:MAG: hypothetical protein WGN25_12695 [Candidatus Electrothrix sp. GW3-4]|uniref:hypothetical protein n=1 Tax=Candidatus Electrothrix sp. GW3-4 TaxID=3126740 RepID=UPI0030CD5E38